ncbi:MAG: AAA family ATPase [Phycisphaerae bacterium]|jgi:chromosome partitioning protein|nr:AAA family ATPase [Phycisphaerae bacterium]
MRDVQTLAIINQKGGVGKTTTVANLGAAIAARGKRLCLVDMDPQAHLTLHVGLEPGANNPGLYEVLTGDASMSDAAVKLNENLSAVPSVIDLAAAETELVTVVGREQILNDRLAGCNSDYDYVMIDCPPSLGLLTLNALAAADYVFIPLQAHFLALQGLGMLLETVALVQQRINPRLKVGGVILCMHEKQTRLAGEVVADLEEFLNSARDTNVPWSEASIFKTAIRRNIKLAECPSYGKTIFDYDPYSHGAIDYDSLAEEFMAFFSPQKAVEDKPAETSEPVETVEEIQQPQTTQAPPAAAETEPAVDEAAEPVEQTPEPADESPESIDQPPGSIRESSEPVSEAPEPTDESPGEFRSEAEPTSEPDTENIPASQPAGETAPENQSPIAPVPPQPLQ